MDDGATTETAATENTEEPAWSRHSVNDQIVNIID